MNKARLLVQLLDEIPKLTLEAHYEPRRFAKLCGLTWRVLDLECRELFGMSSQQVLAYIRLRKRTGTSLASSRHHPRIGNEIAARKANLNGSQALASHNVRIVMKTKAISIVPNFPHGGETGRQLDIPEERSPQFWKGRSGTAQPRRLLQAHANPGRPNRLPKPAPANIKTSQEKASRPLLQKQGKGRICVALVDDDKDMRLLMKGVLEQTGACICVGTFPDATKALAGIPELNPDVVLMDIGMPGLDGIECTRRLKQAAHQIRIIMLTGLHDENLIRESLEAGADAYLLKPVTANQCLATIKFVLGREAAGFLLTTREREVMECLADGLLYKEIAEKLNVSYSAVHKHQHSIFVKLNVTNRSEAIHKWHELGGKGMSRKS